MRDIFEFNGEGMTFFDRAWRVAFMAACVGVALLDLFVWRP